jgi:hypothetical protein
MASYPAYKQLLGSTEEWVDDLVADRAVAGNVKVRAMFTSKKKRFLLRHKLTTVEVFTSFAGSSANALTTFYDTNRLLTVTLTWAGDGASYTCLFGRSPRVTWDNVGLADVDVELLQQ